MATYHNFCCQGLQCECMVRCSMAKKYVECWVSVVWAFTPCVGKLLHVETNSVAFRGIITMTTAKLQDGYRVSSTSDRTEDLPLTTDPVAHWVVRAARLNGAIQHVMQHTWLIELLLNWWQVTTERCVGRDWLLDSSHTQVLAWPIPMQAHHHFWGMYYLYVVGPNTGVKRVHTQ